MSGSILPSTTVGSLLSGCRTMVTGPSENTINNWSNKRKIGTFVLLRDFQIFC